MTPKSSRLLIRHRVDTVIGQNLVRFTELYMRDEKGTKVGDTNISRVGQTSELSLVIGPSTSSAQRPR